MKKAVLMWALSCGLVAACAASSVATQAEAISAPLTFWQADTLPVLHDRLKSWVISDFKAEGVTVRVDLLGAWGLSQAMLPAVASRVAFRRPAANGWQVELVVCPALGKECDGEAQATVRYQVKALEPVWVVVAAVKKGDAMTCDLFRREWHEIRTDRAHADWAESCESLKGGRARRPLQPGDVLQSTDLMLGVGVMERDTAVVMTRLGQVEIQAQGTVLADAMVGQQVPIRLKGQTTVLRGVVAAPGVIQVEEGL